VLPAAAIAKGHAPRDGRTQPPTLSVVAAAIALLSYFTAPAVSAQGTPVAEESKTAPVTVTGTIVFPDDVTAGPPATVHVRIEDVSRADAPATVLAEVTLEAVDVPPAAGEAVTFAIPVDTYDPRLRYAVRVHVDRDGDGRVSSGDLVSTTHVPVLTHDGGTEVTVPVSVVGAQAAAQVKAGLPPVVWELVGFVAADGAPVEIADPSRYTLQFLPTGRVVAKLDCNQGSGGYAAADGVLTLTPMAVTLKLCLGESQAAPFQRLLAKVTSYRFDPEAGDLLLRGAAGVLKLQPALSGVLWQWQGNTANDGTVILRPGHPEDYTVTFLPEGRLVIQADCNRAMGSYTVTGGQIDLQIGGVTKMACPPGSLMDPFLADLDRAVSYGIFQGTLALALDGGGVMTFAPVAEEP
jgi:heat shock protein HslJ/uncharacterized lipoprotein YbaY